jgi:hypothetical protein
MPATKIFALETYASHFADRDSLLTAALGRWEALYTERVIRELELVTEPRERLRRLIHGISTSGEAWRVHVALSASMAEPVVAKALSRVSRRLPRDVLPRPRMAQAQGAEPGGLHIRNLPRLPPSARRRFGRASQRSRSGGLLHRDGSRSSDSAGGAVAGLLPRVTSSRRPLGRLSCITVIFRSLPARRSGLSLHPQSCRRPSTRIDHEEQRRFLDHCLVRGTGARRLVSLFERANGVWHVGRSNSGDNAQHGKHGKHHG